MCNLEGAWHSNGIVVFKSFHRMHIVPGISPPPIPNRLCGWGCGLEGILYGPDYRGTEVMAATTFVKSLLVGLVAKVDQSELMIGLAL